MTIQEIEKSYGMVRESMLPLLQFLRVGRKYGFKVLFALPETESGDSISSKEYCAVLNALLDVSGVSRIYFNEENIHLLDKSSQLYNDAITLIENSHKG